MNKLITFLSGTAIGAVAILALMPNNRKKAKDSLLEQVDRLESNFNDKKEKIKKGYNKQMDGLAKKGHKMVDELHETSRV